MDVALASGQMALQLKQKKEQHMYWSIFILTLALFFSGNSNAAAKPKIVSVTVEKSYVPIGFDDNDRVQLTVAGIFPNTCYKVANVDSVVDTAKKTIQIWQTAYQYSGVCLNLTVPFTQNVNVGLVAEGNYSLLDGPTGKVIGTLPVIKSTRQEADDFLYAPVGDAFLTLEASGAKGLALTGEFMDRCTELQEVRISYPPEAIIVQPIARRTGEGCKPEKVKFSKIVPLDAKRTGINLLHVRSMDGQAIHKLVDLNFDE